MINAVNYQLPEQVEKNRVYTVYVNSRESVDLVHHKQTWKLLPFLLDGQWQVRFSCPLVGEYTLGEKKFHVVPYGGQNCLYKHGPVIRKGNKLLHADGTPFFWFGDTQWFAMTQRCSVENFKKILKKRKQQKFTVIQTVVGIPPEVGLDSPNTKNRGGAAFTSEGKLNAAYFTEVDAKIEMIVSAGMVPCIVGSWGHHMDTLGIEAMKALWREIIARYSAYPVIFCLTGEVDIVLPPGYAGEYLPVLDTLLKMAQHVPYVLSLLKKFGYFLSQKKLEKRLLLWDQVAEFIDNLDPYQCLLTVHPQSMHTARELFPDAQWLDINSIQSGHSYDRREWMETVTMRESNRKLPFVNLEPWYEQICGLFGQEDQIELFDLLITSKTAGFTYGAHGLWNMGVKGDKFLSHWGDGDWHEALNYAGAQALSDLFNKHYFSKM